MRTHERMESHRNTGLHEIWHLLYRPASLGRQHKYRVRVPLLHRIHLVPGRWIEAACSRYDTRQELARYYRAAPVEPPVAFIAAPKMPEAELEALRRRAHP